MIKRSQLIANDHHIVIILNQVWNHKNPFSLERYTKNTIYIEYNDQNSTPMQGSFFCPVRVVNIFFMLTLPVTSDHLDHKIENTLSKCRNGKTKADHLDLVFRSLTNICEHLIIKGVEQ